MLTDSQISFGKQILEDFEKDQSNGKKIEKKWSRFAELMNNKFLLDFTPEQYKSKMAYLLKRDKSNLTSAPAPLPKKKQQNILELDYFQLRDYAQERYPDNDSPFLFSHKISGDMLTHLEKEDLQQLQLEEKLILKILIEEAKVIQNYTNF